VQYGILVLIYAFVFLRDEKYEDRFCQSSWCSDFDSQPARNLIICTLRRSTFQMKDDELGGASSRHASDDKCVLNFGRKTRRNVLEDVEIDCRKIYN
jgi:hypothetical protein